MKKTFLIALLSIFYTLCWAQYSQKYGKITEDELKMTVYSKDSSAPAVFIYEDSYVTYNYLSNIFQITIKYSAKIKILKPEGVEYANFSIPLYFKNNNGRETLSGLEAISYNLENGKVVKTKTEKQFIFSENVSPTINLTKVSIQGAKVGSVIEYKYSINSPFIYNIPSFKTQHKIPVIYGKYNADIPEYFNFQFNVKGYENLSVKEESRPNTLNVSTGQGLEAVKCVNRDIMILSADMPAMKDEPMVWCTEEYMSLVEFQLSGVQFPFERYEPYSRDWKSIEKTLEEYSMFGDHYKISNPLEKETKEIMTKNISNLDKIGQLHQLVLNNTAFNGQYSLFCNRPQAAIKNKTGNNSEINFTLMGVLNDAGYKAYPVLLRERASGRLVEFYPSIDNINYFIIAVDTPDGKTYFLDGADRFSSPNVLSSRLLTKGYIINPSKKDKWVDLSKISNSVSKSDIFLNFNSEMDLVGTIKNSSSNQFSYARKSEFNQLKSKDEYIKSLESKYVIKIDSSTLTGFESYGNIVEERLHIKKGTMKNDSYVYINPVILPKYTKSPFIESNRKLPVEFDYPSTTIQYITIVVPDNYTVEELPKGAKISLMDNGIVFSYLIQRRDNVIMIMYNYTQNQIIFPNTDYAHIKEFFTIVANKNVEQIVLKKK